MATGQMSRSDFATTYAKFVAEGKSLVDLANHLKVKGQSVEARAKSLREQGVNLPKFPRKSRVGGTLDIAKLNESIGEILHLDGGSEGKAEGETSTEGKTTESTETESAK